MDKNSSFEKSDIDFSGPQFFYEQLRHLGVLADGYKPWDSYVVGVASVVEVRGEQYASADLCLYEFGQPQIQPIFRKRYEVRFLDNIQTGHVIGIFFLQNRVIGTMYNFTTGFRIPFASRINMSHAAVLDDKERYAVACLREIERLARNHIDMLLNGPSGKPPYI